MIAPAAVISNMPKGSKPCCRATPSTSMFVEVPIIVQVPPKIVAKDSGISSFEGATEKVCAKLIMTGVRITTTGVLLMKADITITPAIIVPSASTGEYPAAFEMMRPKLTTLEPPRTELGRLGVRMLLDQLGVTAPVVSTPICLSPSVAAGYGGDLPQWTYGVAQTLSADLTTPQTHTFIEAATSVGLTEEDLGQVWVGATWSVILGMAKVMNEVGVDTLAPDTLAAALDDFPGPVVMGAPELECGKYPAAPAVCNDRARFYDYEGMGSFVPVSGWLQPPA
jgi:hypothetical protein